MMSLRERSVVAHVAFRHSLNPRTDNIEVGRQRNHVGAGTAGQGAAFALQAKEPRWGEGCGAKRVVKRQLRQPYGIADGRSHVQMGARKGAILRRETSFGERNGPPHQLELDRKSTRLNSSHGY